MEKLVLNFFGEEITIDTPKTLQNLKDEIASKFCFNPSDAAEILVSYFNDLKKVFIQTEQDFVEFVKKHIYKVDLDISQESQLYKNSMKQLEEENAQNKKTLEELLKKNMEVEAKAKAFLDEKTKKIKEIDEKIKALNKKKAAISKEVASVKEKKNKIIKTNQKKINEIQKKLGIAPPVKKPKPASPKPKVDKKAKVEKKIEKKVEKKVEKVAKKIEKIIKKVEKKKKDAKKPETKEEKKEEKEDKGFFNLNNINEITQNLTNKITDIAQCVIEKGNELTNKITGKLENKDIKLKDPAPKKEEEKKKIHTGIHCNGCGMNPIEGNRFKCAVCENFDYCEKCESLNKDKHLHPFIKIYSPETAPIKIECELK